MASPAYDIRIAGPEDASAASGLVHRSFLGLAADGWTPPARDYFLNEASPQTLHERLQAPAYAASACAGGTMVGFLLMPQPSLVAMLFVDPDWLRLGIGRALWEGARAHMARTFPDVKTVELNATRYALGFYRSVGFVPISTEFTRGGCVATRMACWLPARELGAELSSLR